MTELSYLLEKDYSPYYEQIYKNPNEEIIQKLKEVEISIFYKNEDFVIFSAKEEKYYLIFISNQANRNFIPQNVSLSNFDGIYSIKPLEKFKIRNTYDIADLFRYFHYNTSNIPFNKERLFRVNGNIIYFSSIQIPDPLTPSLTYDGKGQIEIYLKEIFSYKEEE